MVNGKKAEIKFRYDDSGMAYHKSWKDLIDCWANSYGGRAVADRYMRKMAHGVVMAGNLPILSAEKSGPLTNEEKKSLMDRISILGSITTIEEI